MSRRDLRKFIATCEFSDGEIHKIVVSVTNKKDIRKVCKERFKAVRVLNWEEKLVPKLSLFNENAVTFVD
jgi:hypothetical protein